MRYFVGLAAILCLILTPTIGIRAQSNQTTADSGDAVPENAFLSPSKYTNAFFGFSLPLPGVTFQRLSVPALGPSQHFLFGFRADVIRSQTFAPKPTITILMVEAEEAGAASADKAKEFVGRLKSSKPANVVQIEIGGKVFWKTEGDASTPAGKLHQASFATSINGYALEFDISSFDAKLTDQLKQSIASLAFFDPRQAKQIAGTDSVAYIVDPLMKLTPGTVIGSTYTNRDLGLSYKFPDGWVVADAETQQKVIKTGHDAAWGKDVSAAEEHDVALKCTRVLLLTTRVPEGTKSDDLNPMIVLMATDSTCTQGFRFPASIDDHAGINLVAQQMISAFSGSPLMLGQQSLHAFAAGQGHLMIVLSGSSTVKIAASNTSVPVFTAMAFTMARGYLLAWVFESGSQAELDKMMDATIAWN